MKIQEIIVGIDEGSLAAAALETAVHLSRAMKVPLRAIHVIDTRTHRPWFASDPRLEDGAAKALEAARVDRIEALQRALAPLAITPAELEGMVQVAIGRPSRVLRERVETQPGALLVLGGHQRRGILDFGGTARELMSHPPCAMWIQGEAQVTSLQRVLAAVDLSIASREVSEVAIQVAQTHEAVVVPFYCYEAPVFAYSADIESESGFVEDLSKREEREFQAFVEDVYADSARETRFVAGDPAEQILAAEPDHDVIVMGTHGHNRLGRVFLGSHAYEVLSGAKKPVLIVPTSAAE